MRAREMSNESSRQAAGSCRPQGRARRLGLTATVAVAMSLGCQTYHPEVAIEMYRQGDFVGAYEEIADPPWYRAHHDHDEVIWLLEEAKVLRDLQRYEQSSETFERALNLIEGFLLMGPDVSVTEELTGILGSQVLRDYKGSFADAILATTLLALNDLAIGNAQNARAAAQQSYEWQKEAKIYFEEELARADELAQEEELDREAILATSEIQAELAAADGLARNGHADFLNPLASFVEAIANFAAQTTADRGVIALEAVAEMVPGNSHVRDLLDGTIPPADNTVYIIYERGMAPAREEFRVTVPAPLPGTGVSVTSVAIPVLRPRADPAGHLRIRTSDGALDIATESIVDVDSIVATQFKDELPGIIIRTVIATVAKEVASYAANKAVQGQSPWVRIFAWLGTASYKVASSGADIRTWQSLGSEFQVAAFTLPPDGAFELTLVDNAGRPVRSETLELREDPITVVCVRSIGLSTLRIATPAGARTSPPPPSFPVE